MINEIWVFHGTGGKFASGVFSSRELAENWVETYDLEGVLTKYPINVGVYDWAIQNHLFLPKKPEHSSPAFIQQFTAAGMEHYHFQKEDV